MNMKKKNLAALCALACTTAFSQELNAAAKHYKIGDKGSGGGIVFYYSEEGFSVQDSDDASPVVCHYLECSPNQLESMTWCPCEGEKWCDINTSDGVGAGKLNTARIVNYAHEKQPTPSNCAAYVCLRYSTETTKEGEWYLPSKLELDLIYKNLRKSGKIGGDAWHWSSSQSRIFFGACDQRFGDGSPGAHYKDYRYCVRAVRAF